MKCFIAEANSGQTTQLPECLDEARGSSLPLDGHHHGHHGRVGTNRGHKLRERGTSGITRTEH